MKLSRIIIFTFFCLFFPTLVFAQSDFVSYTGGVNLSAAINEDHFSTVNIVPNNIEIGEWATVVVQITDGQGDFLVDRLVDLDSLPDLIYTPPSVLTNSNGIVEIPVSSNVPGTYELCAMDITDPALEIMIVDCKVLYVTPVPIPVMINEPSYTKGNSNMVFWSNMGAKYEYSVEVSLDSDFSTILNSSGWVSGSMYDFNNLQNGNMYFYRVRARNSSGGLSSYSNVVFSVQDSAPPVINIVGMPDIGDNTTSAWDSDYEISFSYTVTDNVGLDGVEFLCIRRNGSKVVCGNTQQTGSLYTTTLRLSDLENDRVAYLYEDYSFCIRANDYVENVSEYCDVRIEIEGDDDIPPDQERPEPATPPVTNIVRKIVENFVDNTGRFFDQFIGDLPNNGLNVVNTTTALVTFTAALTALLGGLLYIPIYLLELLLAFISWLGLRRRGKTCGYVYDSKTKEALERVIVRVYDVNNKLVWTDVTNSKGYFDLNLDDGRYFIKVLKSGYSFPSKIIFGKSDYPLEDVYNGSVFDIVDGDIPNFSIPMDSNDLSKFGLFILSVRGYMNIFLRVISIILVLLGLLLCVYIYYRNSTVYNFILFLIYIPIFVIVIRGLFKRRLKYGVVYDMDGNALSDVSIGLREMEFKKIVYKRVTDSLGRYRFVVESGVYNIEVLDTEYVIEDIKGKDVVELRGGSQLIAFDVVVKSVEK